MVVNGIDSSGPVRAAALVGVVLAGGEGRRMGAGVPKPLRRLGGKTMVAHVVERLRRGQGPKRRPKNRFR